MIKFLQRCPKCLPTSFYRRPLFLNSNQRQQNNQQSEQSDSSESFQFQDSPIHQLFNKERQIQMLKEHNQQKFDPEGYSKKELSELSKNMGKNYNKHINSGFSLEVLGLNKGTAKMYTALYQNVHGKGELVSENGEFIKSLESFNYLDLTKKYNQNQLSFPVKNNEHFSQHLQEYQASDYCKTLKDNQIIVFNFPLNYDESDLEKVFAELGQIQNIEIKDCLTGLPAFAVVEFKNSASVAKARNEWHFKKNAGGKLLDIKTKSDQMYENPYNRTLVLTGLDNNVAYQDIVAALSKIGRIMHFEVVQEAENPSLPTKQEVLEYLEDQLFRGEPREDYIIHDISAGAGKVQQTRWPNSISEEQVDIDSNEARKVGEIIQRLNQERQNKIQQIGEKLIDKTNLYTLDWPDQLKQQPADTLKDSLGRKRQTSQTASIDYSIRKSSATAVQALQRIKEKTLGNNNISVEEVYEFLTEQEKQEIRSQIIEQKKYLNLGYCFCTFVSTDQAKLVYMLVNSGIFSKLGQNLKAFLKEKTDHYFYDAEHLIDRCKAIKINYDQVMNEIKQQTSNDYAQQSRSLTQAQEKQSLREKLMEQASDTQLAKKIESTLEAEQLSKNQFAFDMVKKGEQTNNKLGRNFSSSITEADINEFYSNLKGDVAHQNQQQQRIDEYEQKEELFLEAYRNEARKQGLDELVSPLKKLSPEVRSKLIGSVKEKYEEEMAEEARLKEKEDLENQNWQEKARIMLRQRARRIARREYRLQQKVKKLTKKESGEGEEGAEGGEGKEEAAAAEPEPEKPQAKAPKEEAAKKPAEKEKKDEKGKKKDAYFDPAEAIQENLISEQEAKKLMNSTIKGKEGSGAVEDLKLKNAKKQQYHQFVNDLNIMLQGNFQEDLKNSLFQTSNAHECRDLQGNVYVNEQEEDRLVKYLFPADPKGQSEAMAKYDRLKSMFEALPESFKNRLSNLSDSEYHHISYLIHKQGIPDGSFVPQLSEGQTIEEYVKELNTFAAEPGELYQVSKDTQGQAIVVKSVRSYFKAQLKDYIAQESNQAINQQMFDTFVQLGFSEDQAKKEVFYHERFGQYSENVIQKMQGQLKEANMNEDDIQKFCFENNMNYNEIQSLLKFDFNKYGEDMQEDLEIQLQLEQQKALFGEIKKEDLIKYESVKLKDEKGKYVVSKFKQH